MANTDGAFTKSSPDCEIFYDIEFIGEKKDMWGQDSVKKKEVAVFNTIFGAEVQGQLNEEVSVFAMLPRIPWNGTMLTGKETMEELHAFYSNRNVQKVGNLSKRCQDNKCFRCRWNACKCKCHKWEDGK